MHEWCNTSLARAVFKSQHPRLQALLTLLSCPTFGSCRLFYPSCTSLSVSSTRNAGRASVFLRLKCKGVALRGPGRELIKSSGWFSPPPHMAASWSRPPFRLDSHREGQTCTHVDKHACRGAQQRLRTMREQLRQTSHHNP